MNNSTTSPSHTTSVHAGTKRFRPADTNVSTDNPNEVTHELMSSSSDADGLQEAKRLKLSENYFNGPQHLLYPNMTHWLAFDIVTAGRQGIELGRDQAPIVQISAILGTTEDNKVVDRLIIDLRPNGYFRNAVTQSDSATSGLYSIPRMLAPENQAVSSAMTDQWPGNVQKTCSSPTGQRDNERTSVPISVNATKASESNYHLNLSNFYTHDLLEAMNMLTSWLAEHDVPLDDEPENSRCIVVTDGHVPMRNVLHPQAAYLEVDIPVVHQSPWRSYVNVLDWWANDRTASLANDSKWSKSPCSVTEAFTNLGLSSANQSGELSSKVEQIAAVVQSLISRGVPMCEPQIIRMGYQHKVFPRSVQLEDSCVVEVRQVPWSATPAILAKFFTGLNVIPGGVAIRLTDGRRSNTAIVAFESTCNAQLALARHQHQLSGGLFTESGQETSPETDRSGKDGQLQTTSKPVMLQVYTASACEFIQCAGCDQAAVAEFLNQLTHGEQVVVRIRGLPYTATKQQILEFFDAVQVNVFLDERGIYLVAYPEGRPTGDAFVLFADDKTATRALKRHKDYLGDRYVELFKASPSEMVQVCFNVSQQPHGSTTVSKNSTLPLDAQNRLHTSLSSTVTNWTRFAPYLLQTQNLTTSWNPTLNLRQQTQVPPLLAQNSIPAIRLTPNVTQASTTWTDSLSIGHMFGINIPPVFPSQVLMPGIGSLANVSPSAIRDRHLLEPVTQDLKDPTDPDCPYARQLPPGGVSGLIQLSGLPLETSRHDIRLYLGPVNMSKVYRMRQMVPKINQSTSTWLISVVHTTEGLQLIRDLVHRSFSLTSPIYTGTERVPPNVPTFSLYHVGPDKTPVPIPLHDPSMGIPWNRIYGMCPEPPSPELCLTASDPNPSLSTYDSANNFVLSPNEKTTPVPSNCINRTTSESIQSQLLHALMTQAQSTHIPYSLAKSQLPHNFSNLDHTSLPTPALLGTGSPAAALYQLQEAQTSTNLALSSILNASRLHGALTVPDGISNSASNIVMISGVSTDVTSDELSTLFRPISHLITSPPQFTLYQALPNGTATFLVTFSNPLEAQAFALYCPNGTLRNRPFTACLLPNPFGTIARTSQLPETLTAEYNSLNAITNLMFLPLSLSNVGLPQSQNFPIP